jgi:hypothetical protein
VIRTNKNIIDKVIRKLKGIKTTSVNFRSGKKESYKKMFDSEDLEYFNTQFYQLMKKLNYQDE